MRKADYAALAAILRGEIAVKKSSASRLNDTAAQCAVRSLETVARHFADCASVNRAEFLRACGIEP